MAVDTDDMSLLRCIGGLWEEKVDPEDDDQTDPDVKKRVSALLRRIYDGDYLSMTVEYVDDNTESKDERVEVQLCYAFAMLLTFAQEVRSVGVCVRDHLTIIDT